MITRREDKLAMTQGGINLGPFFYDSGAFWPDEDSTVLYSSREAKSAAEAGPDDDDEEIPYGTSVYTGAILLGLTGRSGEQYVLPNVISIVRELREAQGVDPDASFILHGRRRQGTRRRLLCMGGLCCMSWKS